MATRLKANRGREGFSRPNASIPPDEYALISNGKSRCTSKVLGRLVDLVLTLAARPDASVELIMHLPKEFAHKGASLIPPGPSSGPGTLTIYCASTKTPAEYKPHPAGAIPPGHPLRRAMIMVMVSRQICSLIAVEPESPGMDGADVVWRGSINFLPEEIAAGAEWLTALLDSCETAAPAVQWLKGAIKDLREGDHTAGEAQLWGKLLVDFATSLGSSMRTDEEELDWYQTITRIQDAVGWELDLDQLFASVASVLEETVGYDYLEMQIMKFEAKEWSITHNYHRNLTEYGGRLLTLILKPDRQSEILADQRPVRVSDLTAGGIFANAKLIELMELRSGMIVPLIHRGKPNGLLKLFSRRPEHIIARDMRKFEAIGRIIARSIENINSYHLMRRMATTDALTNVYNRRFFTELIGREFTRSKRYGSSLSLIMIDIDHFKHYNDTNGHLAGDHLLTEIAGLFKQQVRESDIIARFGGEEFVVILPQTTVARGRVVAEKIRRAVNEHPFPNGDQQPGGRVTVSLGVAEISHKMETFNDLVNSADMALYRAKSAGRNRCVANVE